MNIKNINIKKKKIVSISLIVICILIPLTIAFAKYIKREVIKPSNKLNQVIADFYVEITDENQKSINNIGIDELFPGATKNVDFYVKSGEKDKKLDVNVNYTISLMHTKNLPVEYSLYKLSEENGVIVEDMAPIPQYIAQDNTDNEMNTERIIAFGADDATHKFTLEKSKANKEEYDRYRLKVKWPEDKTDNKYINEVDLVYLIVNAVQEEPQK